MIRDFLKIHMNWEGHSLPTFSKRILGKTVPNLQAFVTKYNASQAEMELKYKVEKQQQLAIGNRNNEETRALDSEK